jgi:hypothetical protein
MDDRVAVQPDASPAPTVSDADYEQMYHLLYAYRFGAISFLELLDKLEAILRINPSQVSLATDSD